MQVGEVVQFQPEPDGGDRVGLKSLLSESKGVAKVVEGVRGRKGNIGGDRGGSC